MLKKLLNKEVFIKLIARYCSLIAVIKTYREGKKIRFLLAEIDLDSQKITLQVKWRSLFIKSTIPQVGAEIDIIKGLSSQDACRLGLCYGKLLRASCIGTKKIHFPEMVGGWDDEVNRYQIILQDRQGKIGYTDTHTQDFYLELPMAIACNRYVLCHFSPIQAWHIGVQAGMQAEKQAPCRSNIYSKLRIVK